MRYGIALGSNLGDRQSNLKRALDLMSARLTGGTSTAIAPLYESAPVDCPDGSPNFFNTVVEIETSDQPMKVLRKLRAIEAELGRSNEHEFHAPRTVDLDILYADDVVMNEPELILPHPRLVERRFVLQPLADVRPELVLPLQTRTVRELLEALSGGGAELRIISDDWAL